MELTHSFVQSLSVFNVAFTEPSFQTFCQLTFGWILTHRHHFITELIFTSGNVGNGHGACQ